MKYCPCSAFLFLFHSLEKNMPLTCKIFMKIKKYYWHRCGTNMSLLLLLLLTMAFNNITSKLCPGNSWAINKNLFKIQKK